MDHPFRIFRLTKTQFWVEIFNILFLSCSFAFLVWTGIWISRQFNREDIGGNDEVFLVRTSLTDAGGTFVFEKTPFLLKQAIADGIKEVETGTQLLRSQPFENIIHINGKRVSQEWCYFTDENWFDVFKPKLLYGSVADFGKIPNEVVMCESTALQMFGKTNVVGQTMQVDSVLYTVTAVTYDLPENSIFQYEILLPITSLTKQPGEWETLSYWRNETARLFIKTRSGVKPADLEKSINAIYHRNIERPELRLQLMPFRDIFFARDANSSVFRHGNKDMAILLIINALLLFAFSLLTYLTTVFNGITGHFKNIRIRKTLGATRSNLVRHYLPGKIRNLLATLLIIGIASPYCIQLLGFVTGDAMNLRYQMGNTALLLTVVFILIVISTLLIPALYSLAMFKLIRISDKPKESKTGFRLRISFSVFHVSLLMIVIIFTYYLHEQIQFAQTKAIAFGKENLMIIEIPAAQINWRNADPRIKVELLKNKLLAIPGVVAATRIDDRSFTDIDYQISGGVDWPGKAENFNPSYVSFSLDPSIRQMLGLKMVEGRWFSEDGTNADSNHVVLNQSAIQKFGLKGDVVGSPFKKGIVIGIVEDFAISGIKEDIPAMVLQTHGAKIGGIMVQTAGPSSAKVVEGIWSAFNSVFPGGDLFNVSYVREEYNNVFKQELRMSALARVIGLFTILLTVFSLFGVIRDYLVARRKAFTIRRVLGASNQQLMVMLGTSGLKILAVAAIIGTALASFLVKGFLQGYAYRVEQRYMIPVLVVLGLCVTLWLISVVAFSIYVRKTDVDLLRHD
jgi:putative ABC transport system permease protein